MVHTRDLNKYYTVNKIIDVNIRLICNAFVVCLAMFQGYFAELSFLL